MKISNSGITYRIVDGGTKFLDILPAGVYSINFDPMAGYWLTKMHEKIGNDFKVYGNTNKRIEKVFRTFELRNSNLGILLSGTKGMGKTVFMRSLTAIAIERNMPVLVVDHNIPDIAKFISSLEQECVVLFDEFEKTFGNGGTCSCDEPEDEAPAVPSSGRSVSRSQNQFLTLFDGLSSSKKLFVVAINEVGKISSYFLNRPGRFYYHFKFNSLTTDEASEFCRDKLANADSEDIDRILLLVKYHSISYDTLTAIVTELNNGYTLKETLDDLNIDVDMGSHYYDLTIYIDGESFTATTWLTNTEDFYCTFRQDDQSKHGVIEASGDMSDAVFDKEHGCMYIDASKVRVDARCDIPGIERNGGIPVERHSGVEVKPHEFDRGCALERLLY